MYYFLVLAVLGIDLCKIDAFVELCVQVCLHAWRKKWLVFGPRCDHVALKQCHHNDISVGSGDRYDARKGISTLSCALKRIVGKSCAKVKNNEVKAAVRRTSAWWESANARHKGSARAGLSSQTKFRQ